MSIVLLTTYGILEEDNVPGYGLSGATEVLSHTQLVPLMLNLSWYENAMSKYKL